MLHFVPNDIENKWFKGKLKILILPPLLLGKIIRIKWRWSAHGLDITFIYYFFFSQIFLSRAYCSKPGRGRYLYQGSLRCFLALMGDSPKVSRARVLSARVPLKKDFSGFLALLFRITKMWFLWLEFPEWLLIFFLEHSGKPWALPKFIQGNRKQ